MSVTESPQRLPTNPNPRRRSVLPTSESIDKHRQVKIMRNQRASSRNQRHPRRSATRSEPTVPRQRRRRPPGANRALLFRIYAFLFLLPVALFVLARLAVVFHDVIFPAAVGLAASETAWAVGSVIQNPAYVISFVFVVSLAWCFPWAAVFGDNNESGADSLFRRGRELNSHDAAVRQARSRRGERNRSRYGSR